MADTTRNMFYCENPNSTECSKKEACGLRQSNGLLQIQTLAQGLRERVQRIAPNNILKHANGCEAQSVNGTLRMKHGGQTHPTEIIIIFTEDQPRTVSISKLVDGGDTVAGTVDFGETHATRVWGVLKNDLVGCVYAVAQLADKNNQSDGIPSDSILTDDAARARLGEEMRQPTVGQKDMDTPASSV